MRLYLKDWKKKTISYRLYNESEVLSGNFKKQIIDAVSQFKFRKWMMTMTQMKKFFDALALELPETLNSSEDNFLKDKFL